jgi:inorganic pyrophosphatase
LGAIKAEQTETSGKTMRNDRFIFAPVVKGSELAVDEPDDLLESILPDLEAFFINYNRQEGKTFRPLGFIETREALREIKKFNK